MTCGDGRNACQFNVDGSAHDHLFAFAQAIRHRDPEAVRLADPYLPLFEAIVVIFFPDKDIADALVFNDSLYRNCDTGGSGGLLSNSKMTGMKQSPSEARP